MANTVTILGTNGTKGVEGGTSAFQIDAHNVIDAGNLLIPLKEKTVDITTIWLTHSHLDHILDIAYILDSYFSGRKRTLTICGLPETLHALQEHFLNDIIWPDFSKIPMGDGKEMALTYKAIELGKIYTLNETQTIEAFKTTHTVPSCGYKISVEKSAIYITADTSDLSVVTRLIKNSNKKSVLVVECSFPNGLADLAQESKHYTPKHLFQSLQPLENCGIDLYINHIKPLYKDKIAAEIAQEKGFWDAEILKEGEKIHF